MDRDPSEIDRPRDLHIFKMHFRKNVKIYHPKLIPRIKKMIYALN